MAGEPVVNRFRDAADPQCRFTGQVSPVKPGRSRSTSDGPVGPSTLANVTPETGFPLLRLWDGAYITGLLF